MPIYRIACNVCGREDDIYRSIANMDDLPECCGITMHRRIMATMIAPDIAPYRSTIDGSMVESRAKHREHLKRNGCVEVGNDLPKPTNDIRYDPGNIKDDLRQVVHPILSRARK